MVSKYFNTNYVISKNESFFRRMILQQLLWLYFIKHLTLNQAWKMCTLLTNLHPTNILSAAQFFSKTADPLILMLIRDCSSSSWMFWITKSQFLDMYSVPILHKVAWIIFWWFNGKNRFFAPFNHQSICSISH